MADPRARDRVCDAVGLLAIVLVLLDYFRPALLLLPTVAAGGDTPCHYPTFVWFKEKLLPEARLHGWYPGAYLGHPLLLYYFPLPFLVMSALAPFFGMPVAFKLGTALPVFLLPVFTYAGFRLMGFRFPGPLMGAVAAAVFLFLEENPIWGGTIASTLTGEFSYTYGLGLAVLFLGLVYRAYTRGEGPLGPALLLGLVAFAHGYAVLWAGLSATYFLWSSRRPWRTLAFLATVAILGFSTAGVLLVPLLADWGYTTPYNDPWITVTTRGLVPPFLWPLVALAVGGIATSLALRRQLGGLDHRLLFLAHSVLVGAALAAAGPALGVIDVRFVPFAQFAVCLVAGASLGLALQQARAPRVGALGLVLLGLLYGDGRSQVVRHWIDWNYSGLEAKEQWPAFTRMAAAVRGRVQDPRVAVEYSALHEKAGSIRMYETLPHFSGRSTLEGVYNQASLTTHSVYYLASELGATSPNPFREIDYGRFDPDAALDHLRFFNTSLVVALSPQLTTALESRTDVTEVARHDPYAIFRVEGGSERYVVAVQARPVRSAPLGWRDKALRWFSRRPFPRAPLVFTADETVGDPEVDPWLKAEETPLDGGVELHEAVEAEAITVRTNRPGHPLLVKVGFHPRWRVEGAAGPYLVAPALMLVVPREETVRLRYARTAADHLGAGLSLLSVTSVLVWRGVARRRRLAAGSGAVAPPPPPLTACGVDEARLPRPPRRFGAVIPAVLLLGLASGRLLHRERDRAAEARGLYERASQAYAQERFADAAELSRHAAARSEGTPMREEMLCLRGESLLRSGETKLAVQAFDTLLRESPDGPYTPQALFSGALARERIGDATGAAADRQRLREAFPETPWTQRLAAEGGK